MLQKLKYRIRYWWRRLWLASGVCPNCFTGMNYTCTGRGICPKCGH